MQITISQALGWKKTLQERHQELTQLRNENSRQGTRLFGENKEINVTPTYDAKVIDKLITKIAREMRVIDEAIKTQNALTKIEGYDKDESVLGELS